MAGLTPEQRADILFANIAHTQGLSPIQLETIGKWARKEIVDAVADEREQCAKLADPKKWADKDWSPGRSAEVAVAIRGRAQP